MILTLARTPILYHIQIITRNDTARVREIDTSEFKQPNGTRRSCYRLTRPRLVASWARDSLLRSFRLFFRK